MKKRKTYEISVIDKTYSNTITDETKFYTSDTALELVFKLKETEYNFESAEIVLLNIDDRSLVTRPITKSSDSFTYELDDDIIAHYGDWRGQLRFEQTGETYISSPFKFRIENDLGNDRPPQLSDVQSWVSLRRYADGLVDELKQAVLSVDDIEDTFNTNETNRQIQFDSAEQERQTTFETNESERNETFESNETTRQSQELEREKAEGTRQTTFTNNEAIRTETFNTNEATRQENETTRQQAETQRATAESSRESAEVQRKIDHANRSAELDGKANKQQEEWITPTLTGGATTPSGYEFRYRKNEMGIVEFIGRLVLPSSGVIVLYMPVGYRPITDRASIFGTVIGSYSNNVRLDFFNTGPVYTGLSITNPTVDFTGASYPTGG